MFQMDEIVKKRNAKRGRVSSYDVTGGNDDRKYIQPGETFTVANLSGAGCIRHIWMTLANEGFVVEKYAHRKIVLRMYWDGEEEPSVQAPLGDFFGMGHGITKNFVSAPLQMSPQDGQGMNCWWPMPYGDGARITVTNECNTTLILYYYVDYETLPELPADTLRFHAWWNRQCPTDGTPDPQDENHNAWCFEGENTDGAGNYTVLEAKGAGHYCGCHVNIHNLNPGSLWDWPGEGDDMIFIDGDTKPTLHGTGTEDYVNMAWCPTQEYSAPYHGLILGGKDNWKGKITYYRYHIQDPIMFEKDIRVTIEHGHANHRSDDWSTTAYWYQTEPHMPFAPIAEVEDRLPIDEEILCRTGKIVFDKSV